MGKVSWTDALLGIVIGYSLAAFILGPVKSSDSGPTTYAAIICPNAPPIQVKKYELVQGRIVFKFQGMKTIAPMTCGVVEVGGE